MPQAPLRAIRLKWEGVGNHLASSSASLSSAVDGQPPGEMAAHHVRRYRRSRWISHDILSQLCRAHPQPSRFACARMTSPTCSPPCAAVSSTPPLSPSPPSPDTCKPQPDPAQPTTRRPDGRSGRVFGASPAHAHANLLAGNNGLRVITAHEWRLRLRCGLAQPDSWVHTRLSASSAVWTEHQGRKLHTT